ncbi:MAG: N-acetyl-gamma-glutamyl-phosphate reductase [bacterium]|nr:N-acetyl-gamma-glutamyl-phosphate reductase [bacterium]
MPSPAEIPAPALKVAVLGASGYVAGELMRLLAFHPRLELTAAISRSQAGRRVTQVFPHLRGVWDGLAFGSDEDLNALLEAPRLAVFSCLPHGQTAARLDALLAKAEECGTDLHLVDLSADFRLPSPRDYEEVYGEGHGAPGRYGTFTCALPELLPGTPKGAVAHPGCFTTAVTLACAPAQARGLARPPHFRVSAVTGSTGSGRKPSPTTHHPERQGNLRAYLPLAHRHAPEMEMLLGRLGGECPEVSFVPHSGPFSRGIHATVHFDLAQPMTSDELAKHYAAFYAMAPFVSVASEPPNLKEVVATNRCRLGVAARGTRAVVLSVIDNLTKGAAGGAVQWMNRLCGFEETAGLELPGVGWA